MHLEPRRPILVLAALALMAGCSDDPQRGPTDPDSDRLGWTVDAALTAANSCEDAHAALKAAAITQMELQLEAERRCFLDHDGCVRALGGVGEPAMDSAETTAAPARDDASPDEYSRTNTQVEGVDEADVVKTDGERIFALFGQDFVAFDSWPAAETAETGRVGLKGWPGSFYLTGDRAVVLSWVSFYDFLAPEDKADYEQGLREWDYRLWQGGTLVTVIDLASGTPVVTAEHLLGGYLLDSRRIGDKIYVAQNDYIWIDGVSYWPEDIDWQSSADAVNAAFDRLHRDNVAVIEALPLDWWLPKRYELHGGVLSPDDPGEALVACTDVFEPNVYAGQSLVTLVTYDLTTDDFDASAVSGDWGTVYGSGDALYVASTNWGWQWFWTDTDRADVPPISTHIHKFALGSDGVARYSASGNVRGYPLNQFSFDEYQGNLRVATTDGVLWWGPVSTEPRTESRVTVLAQEGGRLVEKGLVDGLGEGETIHAVRFMGDLGYVVTFRQIDPLYVIDLEDQSAPRVAGELKVPGFSSYIQALPGADSPHLLTIGREADDEGRVGGLKLEIFDVGDPSAPRSVKTAIIGDSWNTWSEAQWNHKAFTYYPERELLAIPVSGWDTDHATYWRYQSELFVFRVTPSEIEPIGAVSHLGMLEDLGVDTGCRDWYGWNSAWVSRAVFIEDYVYSLSNVGLAVHDTRDFEAGAVTELVAMDTSDFDDWYGYGGCLIEERWEE